MQVSGGPESVGPQHGAHRLRPALLGMQELLSRALGEVANGPLCNSILEMSIHSAEGEFLVRFLARADKSGVGEAPIVTVVVGNPDAVLGGVALEGSLGVDSFGRGEICFHQIDELQP